MAHASYAANANVRTAKIITGIGYDVKDDHQMLQELENGYVTHKLIDYVQLKRPTC